jgi:hypothetical protein
MGQRGEEGGLLPFSNTILLGREMSGILIYEFSVFSGKFKQSLIYKHSGSVGLSLFYNQPAFFFLKMFKQVEQCHPRRRPFREYVEDVSPEAKPKGDHRRVGGATPLSWARWGRHPPAGFDLWGQRFPRFRYVYPILEHSGSVGLSPFSIINLLELFETG